MTGALVILGLGILGLVIDLLSIDDRNIPGRY